MMVIRLEQKLENNEQVHEQNINRLQKEVNKTLNHFRSQWTENLK